MGLPDEGEMNMYGYQAPYAHNYGRTTQNGFGGINAALSADNGEVLSLLDMCSDNYPLLSTRPERWLTGTYTGDIIAAANVNGVNAYIRENESGYTLVYDEREYDFYSGLKPGRGKIVGLGSYVLLFPFKMYLDTRARSITQLTAAEYSANLKEGGGFNRTVTITDSSGVSYTHTFGEGELFNVTGMLDGSLGRVAGIYEYSQGYARRIGFEFGEMKSKVVLSCKFLNGTYAGESAAGNTIELQYNTTTEINLYPNLFRPGDAVKISGCATVEANNKTAVIREVNGNKLIFYENTFTLPEGQTEYTEESVTIERDIPKLRIVFSHNNRLWGANDRSIYCSKAGDPFIWSDYESLADGCWWADSGCTERYGITGGVAYEYPRFFSDEHIYTVYGNTPEDFSISCVEAKGTPLFQDESFATAGGVLFYLSDNGFMAYTGSYPQKIDTQLGNKRFINALAASDGRKYYVQCWEWDGLDYMGRHFYVYDTLYGVWHEESTDAQIQGFFPGVNLEAAYGGEIWTLGKPYQRPAAPTGGYTNTSDTPTGKVIFADFTMDSVNRKQLKDIIIRHDIGGELTVRLYIDDVLDDSFTRTLTGAGKRTSILPCVPKRCDHWHLELEGPGPWVVYSVAANYIEGSAKK